jgi:lipoyl-dependent peroxiredoxin
MAIRKSSAVWQGNLKSGSGVMRVGRGVFEGSYTFASRFEEGPGTNPEELLGAAHAGCFSMFLADILATDGYTVRRIATTATVHLVGPTITLIELDTQGEITGIDEAGFIAYAEKAKVGCPVSKALAAVEKHLTAKLVR